MFVSPWLFWGEKMHIYISNSFLSSNLVFVTKIKTVILFQVLINVQHETETLSSPPNSPLEPIERSISVQEPTLKHSLQNSESWYNSSVQQPKPLLHLYSNPFFQHVCSDDSHLPVLRLNCHTGRAASAVVCSTFMTDKQSSPCFLCFI